MALLGTNLTELFLLEGTIQQGQFTKLLLFVDILFVVNDYKHLVDHVSCCVDRSLVVSGDDNMKRFTVTFHHFAISSTSGSFFDGSFTTNGNLTTSLCFQLLLSLSTWANDETDKIVLRVFFDGDPNLVGPLSLEEAAGSIGRVHIHELFQNVLALVRQTLSPTNSSGILPLTIGSVDCSGVGEKVGMIRSSWLVSIYLRQDRKDKQKK